MKFMNMRIHLVVALWLALGSAPVSCDRSDEPRTESSSRPLVCTSFYPTEYFVRRIAGDSVEVRCPLPADADPIFWKPDAGAISVFQKADLIVLNGAGFERWVENASLPLSRVVNTAESFQEEWITIESAVTHKHGPEGEHSHEGLDGHTWLDPQNAIAQASAIHEALVARLPQSSESFSSGFAELRRDLEELDRELRSLSSDAPPRLLCSHPAYNYVARRYGWEIHNLDLDPGAELSTEEIEGIRSVLESFPTRWILWESEPLEAVRDRLNTEFGLESVLFSPASSSRPRSGIRPTIWSSCTRT